MQYKRQYGQPVISDMAVVVQEMVASDAAGVMFTCDPVSNSISKTARYDSFLSLDTAAAGRLERHSGQMKNQSEPW